MLGVWAAWLADLFLRLPSRPRLLKPHSLDVATTHTTTTPFVIHETLSHLSQQMALQKTAGDSRAGPMLKDMSNDDSSSTSSLTVLDRKGLVSLHRAKYSPRPTGPGMAGSNGVDA